MTVNQSSIDNKVFVERLNRHALKRYNVFVDNRVLRRWVEEGIMPKATAKGRREGELRQHWERSCAQYKRALLICRIKRQDIEDYSNIRVLLWLNGADDIDFDWVYDDLVKAHSKMRNRLLRLMTAGYDPRGETFISRDEVIVKQMGEASPYLPDLGISAQDQIKIFQAAVFGTPEIDFPNILGHLMPDEIKEAAEKSKNIFEPFNAAIPGILGDPKEIENSGEDILKRKDRGICEKARILCNQMLKDLGNGSYQKQFPEMKMAAPLIGRAMKYSIWQINIFFFYLNMLYGQKG